MAFSGIGRDKVLGQRPGFSLEVALHPTGSRVLLPQATSPRLVRVAPLVKLIGIDPMGSCHRGNRHSRPHRLLDHGNLLGSGVALPSRGQKKRGRIFHQ